MKKASLLGATTLFAVAMSISQPAFAQEAPCPDDDNDGVCNDDETNDGAIIVTGTRIARPTLDSQVPLTSVTPEELTGTGEVSLGDALNDLPSLRSTFSSGNSSRFIGTAGLNFLDLRGLGTSRTLVLVNGRRHVAGSAGDNRVDINTIPIDLVQRIDIVTGGNSAVYGSDAVAGVVNLIMRRDYDGLSVRGQAGISSRGDRGTYFVSGIWGSNFADGRGNITVSAEYSRQEPLFFRDRDALTGAFSGRCQFNASDVTTGEPAAGDGIPDNTFFCGIRNGGISDNGTFGGLGGGSYLRFADNGDIVIDTFDRNFEAFGSGNGIGGLELGSTLRNTGIMLAAVDRYAFNVLAHFDVSDAFRPFLEAKYVRVDASGEGQPSFFQGSSINNFSSFPLAGDPRRASGPRFACDNGFFTAQNLTQLRSFGLCLGTTAGTTIPGSTVLRGVQTQAASISRFNTDFGGRRFEVTRETYRIVAGVEGTFNDDWRYEVAVNYGRFDTLGFNQNNLRTFDLNRAPDGFLLATDAVIAPATFTGTNFVLNSAGQRVICRVNSVTNARPDCVPFNTFGRNVYDQRAFDFSHIDNVTEDFADQFVVSASLSGDFSQLFELPGGPISFALGAEYRRERSGIDYDELTSSGGTFLNALQDFDPPALEVKDAFGELQFPILDGLPLAHELVLTLAGRVSDYNNDTGTVYAYNIQGVYAPIEDVRFRVAYATSVRAPTQGDLFSPLNQNFQFITDPCNQNIINNGPNRVANCAAAGVPTTANAAVVAACTGITPAPALGAPWFNCVANSRTVATASGGNPNLEEERGRSLTVGVIFEPRFLPGLNFTVDWYRIRVRNLIAALTGQTIANLCYDSDVGLSSPFCASIQRDPATGLFAAPALVQSGFNFAAQRTEGLDFDVSYRRTFDNGQRLDIRFIATRVEQLDNFFDVLNPQSPDRQLSELGDPRWSASFSIGYDFGSWDLRYAARYIGRQTIGAYETQNSYRGLCPASGTTPNTGGINGAAVPCTPGSIVRIAPNNADAFPQVFYPEVIYHDLRLGFDIGNDFRFYAGVSNIFDRQPPLGLLGTAGGEPFDSFGRNFFFGFNAEW
jgi:outer membrane receptor protein involved in Fe transport